MRWGSHRPDRAKGAERTQVSSLSSIERARCRLLGLALTTAATGMPFACCVVNALRAGAAAEAARKTDDLDGAATLARDMGGEL